MSFVSDPNIDDDEDEKATAAAAAQAQRDQFSNPVTGGGTELFGSPGAGGAPTTANPPKSNSSGTGFVGLDKYLAANADQAGSMAGQIATSVGNKASAAQDAVNGLSDSFNQQVQQNTVNFNPDAVTKDISDATSLKAGQTYDSNEVADYGKYAGANYGGPTDLSQDGNYSGTQQKLGDAETALGQTQSEAGRQQLLNSQYGGNGKAYSSGLQRLDQALLEGSKDAQDSLSGVRDHWSGIYNLLGKASTDASTAAANAKATDAATAKAARDSLGTYATDANGTGGAGALGDWSKGVYGGADAATKAYTDAQAGINSSEQGGKWTTAQLQALGLDPNMRTYGVNLNSNPNFISPGTNPTLSNAASADNYARQIALAQLAGVLPAGAGSVGQQVLNQANAGQAGTGAGVGSNPLYSLAKGADGQTVFQQNVAAGQAGIGSQLQNFAQNTLGADAYLKSYDPESGRAVFGSQGLDYEFSTNPNSPEYVGNQGIVGDFRQTGGAITPQTAGADARGINWQAMQSSPEWQQLMNTIYGTLSNPTVSVAQNTGTHIGGLSPQVRMAHGGAVPAPVKEPRIPKMPHADYPMPKLPHFALGGPVAPYSIKTPDEARASLARARAAGDTSAITVLQRQIKAHHPALAGEVEWAGIHAALKGAPKDFRSGGKVPGRAPAGVPTGVDSYAADKVPAMLSSQEIVLPRHVTESRDPVAAAAEFVRKTLKARK